MEKSALAAIAEARPAISQASMEYAGSAWKVVIATFKKDPGISLRDAGLAIARDYADKLLGKVPGPLKFSLPIAPLMTGMRETIIDAVADMLEEKFLAKNLGVAAWQYNVANVFQGGMISDTLTVRIMAAFKSVHFHIRLVFFLLLLPVALETAGAVRRRRKTAGKS